jgi:NTP pyrophosphatase (non-canonical NTP hydrolase)
MTFKVTQTGWYKTRRGELVQVMRINSPAPGGYPVCGFDARGDTVTWTLQGEWLRAARDPDDLVAFVGKKLPPTEAVSTMRDQRVQPSPAVLPLSTALYELHDVVLRTHRTLVNGPLEADRERMLICSAMGLAGEAGEFTEHVKKVYEQGRVLDKEKAIKELGDVLYYVQLAAMALDVSVPEVVQVLQEKLAARYPQGFSEQAAVVRADVQAEEKGAKHV